MGDLAISRYGTNTGMFMPAMASASLLRLAGTVSKLFIPLVGLHAMSNIPAVEAKHAKYTDGKDGDVFVQCIAACDENGKDAHELAKLLCYGICGAISLFKKKEKK